MPIFLFKNFQSEWKSFLQIILSSSSWIFSWGKEKKKFQCERRKLSIFSIFLNRWKLKIFCFSVTFEVEENSWKFVSFPNFIWLIWQSFHWASNELGNLVKEVNKFKLEKLENSKKIWKTQRKLFVKSQKILKKKIKVSKSGKLNKK